MSDMVYLGPGTVRVSADGPEEAPIRLRIGEQEFQFTPDAALRLAINLAGEVAEHAGDRELAIAPVDKSISS